MAQYFINQKFDNWTVREFLEYFKVSQKKVNWIINDKKYQVNGEKKEIPNKNNPVWQQNTDSLKIDTLKTIFDK